MVLGALFPTLQPYPFPVYITAAAQIQYEIFEKMKRRYFQPCCMWKVTHHGEITFRT